MAILDPSGIVHHIFFGGEFAYVIPPDLMIDRSIACVISDLDQQKFQNALKESLSKNVPKQISFLAIGEKTITRRKARILPCTRCQMAIVNIWPDFEVTGKSEREGERERLF
ncbi:MAG: hypothetical protein PHG64_10985 [Paludibacter sp.]|nr:hypothetical protein [Paludibacter sp.]